jgi:hypothetical protein
VGNSSIVTPGDGDPRTHAHFSTDWLAPEDCIGTDRRPVSTTDDDTFDGKNSIKRSRID